MFPPPCSSLLCLVNARNCMFDGGRRREGYCIEDRDGCDKAELSRRSQRRKLRSKPFSTTFETAAVEFRPKFPPPPPPPLCVYVYTRICIRVCVFFLFFFFIPVMPTKTEIRWYRKFAFRTSPRRHLIPNLCELPAPRVIAFASIHPPDELCERRLT